MSPRNIIFVLIGIALLAGGIVAGPWFGDGDADEGDTQVAEVPAAPPADEAGEPLPDGESAHPAQQADPKEEPNDSGALPFPAERLKGSGFSVPYPAAFKSVAVDSDSFPLGQVTALSERGGGAVGIDAQNWIAAYPFPLPLGLERELYTNEPDFFEEVLPTMSAYGLKLEERHAAAAEQELGEAIDPFSVYTSVDGAPGVTLDYAYPSPEGEAHFRIVQVFGPNAGLVLVEHSLSDSPAAEPVRNAFEWAILKAKLLPT